MLKLFKSKTPSNSVSIAKTIMIGICFNSFLLSSVFAAGYILPNGTILYDDSVDHTMYKIEKMVPVSSPKAASQTFAPIETSNVVIEDKIVTYDRPVYIRERVIQKGPVYDIVDVAGTVLVYGLLYDAAFHSFYRHGTHPNHHYHYDRYRR